MRELSDRLTVDELAGWYALFELDPWGEVRADIRAGIVGAATCRAMGAKVSPSDLMPEFDKQEVKHDQALGLAAWTAWVNQHNGRTVGG